MYFLNMRGTASKSNDSDKRIQMHSPGCVMNEVVTVGIHVVVTPADALTLQVRKTVVSTDPGAVDVDTETVVTWL